MILRDPFNLFASRLASGFAWGSVDTGIRIWCRHAREYLRIRPQLKPAPITISYNEWVSSRRYRESLAQELGLDFHDAAVRAVPATAGGSSFDGTTHNGRAERMNVLERWRVLASDPRHRAIFRDDVIELSTGIFGEVIPPSTLRLLRRPPRGRRRLRHDRAQNEDAAH